MVNSNPACPHLYFTQLKTSISECMFSHAWLPESQHPQLASDTTQPTRLENFYKGSLVSHWRLIPQEQKSGANRVEQSTHTHTVYYPSCIYSLYIHPSLLWNCKSSSMMTLHHRLTVLLVWIFVLLCFTQRISATSRSGWKTLNGWCFLPFFLLLCYDC